MYLFDELGAICDIVLRKDVLGTDVFYVYIRLRGLSRGSLGASDVCGERCIPDVVLPLGVIWRRSTSALFPPFLERRLPILASV